MIAKPKPKKCDECRHEFIPFRSTQKVCSPPCAQKLAEKKRAKVERAQDRQKRESLKTRSQWTKEAQIAFNAFIRQRDAGKPCICCGGIPMESTAIGGGFDAGHYRSVGSAPHLRFVEHNCHGQSKRCNRYGSGRAVDYRRGLINRIGIAAVEGLEADQAERKYTIEDLKAIKATYKAKLAELKRENQ